MTQLAFGYIRRSSHKQQENNSIEIQKAHIHEYAQRKGMEVPDDFIFIEDVTSAFSKRARERKELMRMQQTIIETNILRVIFYEESRMDRTGYSFVTDFYRPLKERLPDLDVFTTNSEEPFNPDSPQTQIALLLYRQESEIKSERALGSLIADLENHNIGRPGSKVPYGYDQINKKLVPNEKAEVVTFIFHLNSWGVSYGKIASILNEAGIPSPQAKAWGASSVEKILKNSVYTGNLKWTVYKGSHLEKTYESLDSHEDLVDPFLIHLSSYNVQLQNKYGRLDTPFLFLNKLTCENCQNILQTQNGNTSRNGKKYHYQYYVCKQCQYKIDILDFHKEVIPRILKHVQGLTLSQNTQDSTLEQFNNLNDSYDQMIGNYTEHIDNLEAKGCIAREQGDRELEVMIEKLHSQFLADLDDIQKCQSVLTDLYEAVENQQLFTRFQHLLDTVLGDLEKRLIVLYFADKVFVSPNQPVQILYHQQAFDQFSPMLCAQTTEN